MRTLFATFLLLVSCSSLIVQDKVSLRYNLNKGDKYNYEVSLVTRVSGEMTGSETNVKSKMSINSTIEVSDVSSKETKVNVTFGKISVGIAGAEEMGIQDTTTTIDDLKDFHQEITFSPHGEVLAQKTIGKLSAKLSKQAMGGSQLDKSFSQFLLKYPAEQNIPKGFQWTSRQNDTNSIGVGKIVSQGTMNYTFQTVVDTLGKHCARIVFSMKDMVLKGNVEQAGMSIGVDGDGITNGTQYMELSSGMPIFMTSHTEVDTRLSITGQDNGVMTMSQSTDSIMKLKY